MCILFISIPDHFSGLSKLRQNITPVCTTLPVCISIDQTRSSPESKECLGIDIQDQQRGGGN